MKCPNCGKDVELRNKKVHVDEQGNPVFHQYAICKDCKKQWDLDKQRAKKAAKENTEKKTAAQKPAEGKAAPAKKAAEAPVKKAAPVKAGTEQKPVKKAPAKKAAPVKEKPETAKASPKAEPEKKAVRKAPVKTETDTVESKKAPVKKAKRPADAAAKKAAPVKKAAEAPAKKAAPAKKKPASAPSASQKPENVSGTTKKVGNKIVAMDEERYLGNVPPEKIRSKRERVVKQGYEEMLATDTKKRKSKKKEEPVVSKPVKSTPDVYDDDFKPIPRFRALRVIFGILSILIAAFYAFNSYSAGLMESTEGMTFLILAACMALAGLFLIILNGTNNILAFLLPMILYLGSGVYAFLNRADETFLLYGAIIGAAFSVLFIILAISSRGDEEDYENYDDDEDDDWDDDDDDWDDDDN